MKMTIGIAETEQDRRVQLSLQFMDESETSAFRFQLESGEYVTYELQLNIILTNPPPVCQWKFPMILATANEIKEHGVAIFKKGDNIGAFSAFSKALKLVIPMAVKVDCGLEIDSSEMHKLTEALYKNLAACHLNQNNFLKCLILSDRVLERNSNDIKSLYRKAFALKGLQNYQESESVLKAALQLDPKNRQLTLLLNEVLRSSADSDQLMAKRMKKLFQ